MLKKYIVKFVKFSKKNRYFIYNFVWMPLLVITVTFYDHFLDRSIGNDRWQQELLTNYFARISGILQESRWQHENSKYRAHFRTYIREDTISTLNELNDFRKGMLISFLAEMKLINGDKPLVSLKDADLSGLYNDNNLGFSRVVLSGADLRGVNLAGADLRFAILNNSSFVDLYPNFKGADLRGANLTKADLTGANLTGTKNLSINQIKSTCFWENAIFTDAVWEDKFKLAWKTTDNEANQKKIEALKEKKGFRARKSVQCKDQGNRISIF